MIVLRDTVFKGENTWVLVFFPVNTKAKPAGEGGQNHNAKDITMWPRLLEKDLRALLHMCSAGKASRTQKCGGCSGLPHLSPN